MSTQISKVAASQKVYNTATHSIIPFEPLRPGHVGMYVCGATVQSSPHVGHLRAAVAFDIIRRWFTKLGYDVTFVRNVTDIDDKILDKSSSGGSAHIFTSASLRSRTICSAFCRRRTNLARLVMCQK